jgi:hypothetical protein
MNIFSLSIILFTEKSKKYPKVGFVFCKMFIMIKREVKEC